MFGQSKREIVAAAKYEPQGRIARGGETLPGIAGYRGVGPLPKNAMPVTRFNYVRPDGND